MASETVDKSMLIGDVVKKHPESIEVFSGSGLQCIGCHVATWETIAQGAQAHGIDADKLVDAINEKLEVKK